MSLTPGVTGTGPAPAGISSVVSQDDLTRFAQIAGVLKYLTAPLDPPPPPSSLTSVAPAAMAASFSNSFAALKQAGASDGMAHAWTTWWTTIIGHVGEVAAFLIQIVALLLTPLALVILEGLGDLRKGIDPAVGVLAQEVLTEFLGVEVGVANLPLGIGGSDHLARAQAIGGLLLTQLETEFVGAMGGKVQPSLGPAQTFSGLAVNFGLASGIMGVIGGMSPVGHVNELRELGEEVATNIGLGRLVRRALQPLVQTLVTLPATWYINMKYLATQFSIGELVNPYTATTMSQDQLYNAMHLLGYSDDKIAAFIQMHEKKLSPAQVQTLVSWGFWSEQDGLTYIQRQGWPGGFAGNVLQLENLNEVKPWITKEVDLLLSEVGSGQLSINEFAQTIDQFALSQPVKDVIVALANYRAAKSAMHRTARLGEGELEHAFDAGLLTASDLSDRWTAQGLSADDQNTRMALILLRLSRLETVSKEKQQHYNQQLLAFAAKQAAKPTGAAPPMPPIAPFPLNT